MVSGLFAHSSKKEKKLYEMVSIVRDLRIKMQFPNLHFGPGLFDPQGSKVKGQFFFDGPCPP